VNEEPIPAVNLFHVCDVNHSTICPKKIDPQQRFIIISVTPRNFETRIFTVM